MTTEKIGKKIHWLSNHIELDEEITTDKINVLLKQKVYLDVYNNNQYQDWYIHTIEEKVIFTDKKNKNNDYILFAENVKKRILAHLNNENVICDMKKITYTTMRILEENDGITYRIFYLAPNQSNYHIANNTSQTDRLKIMECILRLHFKSKVLSNGNLNNVDSVAINENYYLISETKVFGKNKKDILIYAFEPVITLNRNNVIEIYLKSVAFKSNSEGHKTNSKRKISFEYYQQGNKFLIEEFADARTYTLNHINIDFESFQKTKLAKYIKSYEFMEDILKNLHLKRNEVILNPTHANDDLLRIDFNEITNNKKIYLTIKKDDYDFLQNRKIELSNKVTSDIEILKENIYKEFPGIIVEEYIFDQEPVLTENHLYLCVTLKEKDDDHYIKNGEDTLDKETVQKIMLYEKKLNDLDWYTKVKTKIFSNNMKGSNNLITQGVVFNKEETIFAKKAEKDKKMKNGNIIKAGEFELINSDNLIKKYVYELLIKEMLFSSLKLKFKNPYYSDIKCFKRYSVKEKRGTIKEIFTYIHAKIMNNEIYIKEYKLLDKENYTILSEKYHISSETNDYKQLIMILDDKFIIKVGDNSLNPLPLGSINMFLDDELNPLKTTARSISKKDKYDKNKNLIHSKNSLTKNLTKSRDYPFFINYNLPTYHSLVKKRAKDKKNNTFCLIEFKKKDVFYFCIDKYSLEAKIQKVNRLEKLSFYEIDGYEINQLKVSDNIDMLEFYLSLTTENLININNISKSTILEKMCNVIWDN